MFIDSILRTSIIIGNSFEVIKKDKEILVYPFLSLLLSSALTLLIYRFTYLDLRQVPYFISFIYINLGWPLFLFILYIGYAIIRSFFDGCMVYTAGMRFAGKDATLKSTFAFTLSKWGSLLKWGIFEGIIDALLGALDRIARNNIFAGFVSAALFHLWQLSILFTIPVIIYEDVKSPYKQSIELLRKKFGENVVSYFSFNIFSILLILPVLFILAGFWMLSPEYISQTVIILVVIYILVVLIFLGAVKSIFRTALYIYLKTGQVPKAFKHEIVANAINSKTVR